MLLAFASHADSQGDTTPSGSMVINVFVDLSGGVVQNPCDDPHLKLRFGLNERDGRGMQRIDKRGADEKDERMDGLEEGMSWKGRWMKERRGEGGQTGEHRLTRYTLA